MPRVPLVTCEELRPRSDIHARAFSEASRKGEIGDRWSAGESDSDRWMKGKTISRTTDRWTCTPPAPPPPVKAAEQRTPSVLSSVRWRTFEILLPHFRRKKKFVGSEIWFAFGGENLEEKNCTNFLLGF
jgi:hypothetical protein